MDAQAFRVQKFRCIDDTGWVDISDVTSLIGKNQSGKTAFLKAINKLNPVYGSGDYEPYKEYPRDEWMEYQEIQEENPSTVVKGKFDLEEEDILDIEDQYGENVLLGETITVSKDYSNQMIFDFSV